MDIRVVLQRPTIKNRGNLHGMSTSLNSGKLRETNNAVTRVTSNGRPQISPGHAACFHRLLMIITHISSIRFHHVPKLLEKLLEFYLQILFNKKTIWSIGCLFFLSFQICISRYQVPCRQLLKRGAPFKNSDEVRDTMKNSVHSKASGFLLVQVTTGDMHNHHVASRDARQE